MLGAFESQKGTRQVTLKETGRLSHHGEFERSHTNTGEPLGFKVQRVVLATAWRTRVEASPLGASFGPDERQAQ